MERMYVPSVPVPYIKNDQSHRYYDSHRGYSPHANKQGQRDRPQNSSYDSPILRYFTTNPSFHVSPSQIVTLRIVISQLNVLSIDHLLDLGQCDSVTLRTKCNETL